MRKWVFQKPIPGSPSEAVGSQRQGWINDMPKRRASKHRGAVKDFEAAWLEGDREPGFMYSLLHDFVHQELWNRAGDSENFRWEPGMRWPESK